MRVGGNLSGGFAKLLREASAELLAGGAFLWGYSEALYEFDYFVCDVFFFGVHRYHVIALVQLNRALFGTG